jgi:cytochrome c553
MYLKDTAYRSERWLRAVASLHCMRCFREGATQAAHRDQGKGMSIKTDDCFTAALCVTCHAELGQGKEYTRAQKREMMDAYILQTVRALAKEGLVKP